MPDSIGRYQITGELGHGAMGVVYRATDPTIGRTVALKTIRSELVSHAEGVSVEHLAERFRQEARAAGSLNHRNIVTIYDAGEHQGTFFIAMEYLEGSTLQCLIAERRALPPEEVVGIGTQICAGLDFAHARGIVHRDIKPANIFIATDGTVKIMDFGIAKAEASLAAPQRMTLTGQIVGTPDYMSPEQVKGIPLDGRSDLFSLGVVLYQMATGERPFPGESVTTVIYKIVHETPIAPHALDATVPAGLSAVITRALAKSPDARFPTARAMGDALRSYREPARTGETATLEIPSPYQPGPPSGAGAPRVAREKRRMKRALVWSVIGLLIAAGAMMLSSWHKEQAQQSPSTPTSTVPSPSASAPSSTPMPRVPSPQTPTVPSLGDLQQQVGRMQEEISKSAGVDISKAAKIGVPPMVGELHVTSKPRGATVSVDGKSDGWKTPVNIPSVGIGAHEVKLTMPGYKPVSVTAAVTPGSSAAVKATLMPEGDQAASSAEVAGAPRVPEAATGVVVITSNPPGAKIVLEQYGGGKTTPARLTVPVGRYELVLMKDGYLPATRTVEVKASRVTEVKADLPLIPGVPR